MQHLGSFWILAKENFSSLQWDRLCLLDLAYSQPLITTEGDWLMFWQRPKSKPATGRSTKEESGNSSGKEEGCQEMRVNFVRTVHTSGTYPGMY